MSGYNIGVVGMAVMGQNLALNIESKGSSVVVYNRTESKTREFIEKRCHGKRIAAAYSPLEMVSMLEEPRKIILMVKAGEAVDAMIEQFLPHLRRRDILVDGGNSFFKDTEKRAKLLAFHGVRYLGTGISGGEEGALKGPSIMPGGDRSAYDEMEVILNSIAAKTEDGPCCTYIGPGGAGHYVKMVHNGIEYGMMQLIAECYEIMRFGLGMEQDEREGGVEEWCEEDLGGFLLEITARILKKKDPETGAPIVDIILDKAGQKGTGKWTSQNALDIGVPVPTIDAAVSARILSAFKDERVVAARKYRTSRKVAAGDKKKHLKDLRDALLASFIVDYAQGMSLLRWASEEYGYKLDLAEIARIWQGGCIIRSKLLREIRQAYLKKKSLPNILLDGAVARRIRPLRAGWRRIVVLAVRSKIPVPALSSALAYFDGYTSEVLPANLIQAQRDFFGAHTYQRVDKEGTFHTDWLE